MSHSIDADYQTQWLFPPSLETLIAEDHPARMVREFVDSLDMRSLGFPLSDGGRDGRPHYSPTLLAKAWLYGYMTRTRSCRALERACMENIGLLWLTGMNRPDHTTLWRFWNENQKGIRQLFRQLLRLAVSMNLMGFVLHAVDGTKIGSAASGDKGLNRKTLEKNLKTLDEAIDQILKETAEAGDGGPGYRLPEKLQKKEKLKAEIETKLKELNEADRDHLQPGDPEARMMKGRRSTHFAYNAQAAVDQASGLVVAADVVTDESDNYQLMPMMEQIESNLGKTADDSVFDAGYKALEPLAKAEEKGYNTITPLTEPDGPYAASRFVYDAEKDHCICPRGEVLEFDTTRRRDKVEPYTVRVYRCGQYETCPVRAQCCAGNGGRTVQIHPHHDVQVRHREKMKDERMRQALKKRGAIIESLFGWIKEGMGFRRWTVRGREKVQTQWLLICTAANLIRLQESWRSGKLVFAKAGAA